MSKKSRSNRQLNKVMSAFSTQPGTGYSGPALMVLANPPEAQVMAEISEALRVDAFNREADRLNELPLGHADNAAKIDKTFGPIERWMRNMEETGHITRANDTGLAIFKPERDSPEWYPVAEAFLAMCDTYELIAIDAGVEDKTAGIRVLAHKINTFELVDKFDLAAAKETILWMRNITKPLTPKQFSDYTIAIQIRATMAENAIL